MGFENWSVSTITIAAASALVALIWCAFTVTTIYQMVFSKRRFGAIRGVGASFFIFAFVNALLEMGHAGKIVHGVTLLLIFAVLVVWVFYCFAGRTAPRENPIVAKIYANRPSASRFRNPSNGYEEKVSSAWLWCLLFGCIYFAVKGVWTHAVAAFFLAVFTAGLSWLIYPFFAQQIIERDYLRKGWIPMASPAMSP